MGSRGSFLESGGFSAPAKWQTVGYIDGIKVLRPKDPKAKPNLPGFSNTPSTAYLLLRDNGEFSQLRVFDADRKPILDVDFGKHANKKSLHAHKYVNGDREKNPIMLKPGNNIYEQYKRLFKGVTI